MYRHPYSTTPTSPIVAIADSIARTNTHTSTDGIEYHSQAQRGALRSRSHLSPATSTSQNLIPVPITKRRPDGNFVQYDANAGISLVLFGQEPQSVRVDSGVNLGGLNFAVGGTSSTVRRLPMFGRGAVVDGRVEVLHPETVMKIEAKLEGYVSITESGGSGSSYSPILSETLAFWDVPPTSSSSHTLSSLASTSIAQASAPLFSCRPPYSLPSGGLASSSTSLSKYSMENMGVHDSTQDHAMTSTTSTQHNTPICPSTLPFRTTLPSHYVDTSPFSVLPDHGYGRNDDTNARHSRADTSTEKNRFRFPLPPSFVDASSSIPGFKCEVVYSVNVYVTRGRSRVSSTGAGFAVGGTGKEKGRGRSIAKGIGIGKGLGNLLGKRKFVVRTPIEYRPRTKPFRTLSHSDLFPIPTSIPSHKPFSATLDTVKGATSRAQLRTIAQSHLRSQSYPQPGEMTELSMNSDRTGKSKTRVRGVQKQTQIHLDSTFLPPIHGVVPIVPASPKNSYPAVHTLHSTTTFSSDTTLFKPATLPDIFATLHLPVRQLPIHSSTGIPFALRLSSSDPRVLACYVDCAPNRIGRNGASTLPKLPSDNDLERNNGVYGKQDDELPSFLPLGPSSSFSNLVHLTSLSHSFSALGRYSGNFNGTDSRSSKTTKSSRGHSSSLRVVLTRRVVVDGNAFLENRSSRRGCALFGGDGGGNGKPQGQYQRSKSESAIIRRRYKGAKNMEEPATHMSSTRIIGEGKLLSYSSEGDDAEGPDGLGKKVHHKTSARLAYNVRFAGPPAEISSFPLPRTHSKRSDKSLASTANSHKSQKYTRSTGSPPTPNTAVSSISCTNSASSTAHSNSSCYSPSRTHAVTFTGILCVDPRYTCSSLPNFTPRSLFGSGGATETVVHSPGFKTRNVTVQDFVVVSVKPGGMSGADGSEYGELRMTVPIVLTTDSEE